MDIVTSMVNWLAERKFSSLGIGAFGPLCLEPEDKHYGFVTSTPKEKWRMFDLRGEVVRQLKAKTGKDFNVAIDTDVNACAYLEYKMLKKE